MVHLPAAGVLPILHPKYIIRTIPHHNNAHIYPQVLDMDDLEIQHTLHEVHPAPYPARLLLLQPLSHTHMPRSFHGRMVLLFPALYQLSSFREISILFSHQVIGINYEYRLVLM